MTSRASSSTNGTCPITGKSYPQRDFVVLDHLRPVLVDRVLKDHPSLKPDSRISRAAADYYRMLYVEDLLRQERGELSQLDREVARSLAEGATVTQNVEED